MNRSAVRLLPASIVAIALLAACVLATEASAPTSAREPFATPADLDRAALATFAIMSDNKGSARDSEQFRRMLAWSDEMGAAFTVGMGDHVKRGFTNLILRFLDERPDWRDRFWPNIADGENEFYGRRQSDWAAGRGLLDAVRLSDRPNVTIRANGAEYSARIPLGPATVHLVQLHYPDQPLEPAVAFPAESRAWLCSLLVGIPRSPMNIVIVGAHSMNGDFLSVLSEDQRRIVLDRATLVLSATTHRFERHGYGDDRALAINTGSVCYGGRRTDGKRDDGFVSVHLLADPPRLVIQYVDLTRNGRVFARAGRAFVKRLDTGEIAPVEFAPPEPARR